MGWAGSNSPDIRSHQQSPGIDGKDDVTKKETRSNRVSFRLNKYVFYSFMFVSSGIGMSSGISRFCSEESTAVVSGLR